ncbi:MAG: hypothetical protein EKK37_01520 [Sphingobacteriales bacterium]|nr:MAG: hypothetical protein EKK37_01520 [Sphingobacteriales bacterium]
MHFKIKKSIICKDIDINQYQIDKEMTFSYIPTVGDVAVFEVISIGKHKQIQTDNKLNTLILPGDFIMGAFGTRYATSQFEGYLPADCRDTFHILGAGGTIGVIHSTHSTFSGGPTVLKIVGYLKDKRDNVVNTKKIKPRLMPFRGINYRDANIILSIGSSMDSGKTTTAAYLTRGLKLNENRVAFIKLTGTVYTKDRDLVYDCGADITADFSDYGFPSTYMCDEQELLDLFQTLLNKVSIIEPNYIVIEIADGILQRETKMLLENQRFTSMIDQVIFSSCDSLSALYGLESLKKMGIYPTAISGLLTASPLLIKEVKENSFIPVFTIEQLMYEKTVQLFSKPQMKFAL